MSSLKFRDIELNLVQHITKKNNLRSVFIVGTQEQKNFYLNRFSKFIDKIIVLPNELDIIEKKELDLSLEGMILRTEQKYKMTIFRLFLEDRIIGRGFHSTGGINHPETRLTRSSYKQVLYLASKRIEFWEKVLSENNVKFTLNLPKPIAIIAKSMKIRSFSLNISKFEKRLIWTETPNREPDNLVKEFKKNRKRKYTMVKIKEPHHNHNALRSIRLKRSLKHTFVIAFKSFLQSLKGKIKDQRKGKNIIPFSELSYIWRRKYEFSKLKKLANTTLSEITKRKIKNIFNLLI